MSFCAFGRLGPQIAPGGYQKSYFDNFGALATKCPKDNQIFHFDYFNALTTKWPQESPRSVILSISVHWPQNAFRRPPEYLKHRKTRWKHDEIHY